MEEKTIPNKTKEILEGIIFNQEELDDLKEKIDQVSKGQLKPVELKKQILDNKVTLFERMQTFFQFKNNLLWNEPNSSENHELNAKCEEENRLLQEKDELLETLGKRISNICIKLKSFLKT